MKHLPSSIARFAEHILGKPLYPYQRSPDQDRTKPARHAVVVIGAPPLGATPPVPV